ncbi:MAG: hypothetical protein ACTTH8_08695 [Treponema sp.]
MINKKSIFIAGIILLCAVVYAESVEQLTREFFGAYINQTSPEKPYQKLQKANPEYAAVLKRQADAVSHIFTEVLKTEKQLVPKQCNYIAVYGYSTSTKEVIKQACNNLKLVTLANMDRKSMQMYLAGSGNEIELFKSVLEKLNMDMKRVTLIEAADNYEAAEKIAKLIRKDIEEQKYNMDNMVYRRILLLTAATNTRVGYAAFTAALGNNTEQFILDDFSTLDVMRKDLDNPSRSERAAAFSELLNHTDTIITDTRL